MNDELNKQAQKQARDVAYAILQSDKKPTASKIRSAVELSANTARQLFPSATIDVALLTAYFEKEFQHFMADGRVLDDKSDHVEWLDDARGDVSWKFWERYRTHLDQAVKLPIAIVNNFDTETDSILSRLESPKREGSWDRRGLVVGSVQSGKTGNYTGLVCKAIDAGYKLVIVLAGMHNSLRSQTQIRTDEGVIGFDTSRNQSYSQSNHWVGVGKIFGPRLPIDSFTSSAEKGDFKKVAAKNHTVSLGGNPYILVVKKNVSILKNVLEWVLERNGLEVEKQDKRGVALHKGDLPKVIFDVPFLLVDDEADIASINTKAIAGEDNPDDYDRSAINREIVRLLRAFDQSAYVGYTATPFANIFINPEDPDDIFPRSFIFNLTQPDNYIGATKVFGLSRDLDSGIESRDPLPLVVEVEDQKTSFPGKYKKDHDPQILPPSLKESIDAFVLVCAARRARGQIKVHNSMLIHVARFVAVQNKVKKLVEIELRATQNAIRYKDVATFERLKELWESEFESKTRQMSDSGQINPLDYLPLPWHEVKDNLHEAASKIAVKEINGEAQDILDYVEHKDNGRSVIAIGGDKLSRGLTLEGLSVSYYLRATTMYDTLMQMGRWFGYRDGYLDLCRLYTTPELKKFYEWITMADQELRQEFDAMSFAGRTPRDYGLRVRSHPGGLIVTAMNKAKFSTKMQVTFTGELVQTSYLDKTTSVIEANFERSEKFIAGLGAPERIEGKGKTLGKGTRLWTDVPADKVARFLNGFVVNPKAITAQGGKLGEYIGKQQGGSGDLSQWSVALISTTTAANRLEFGGHDIGLPIRDPQPVRDSGGKPVVPFRESDPSIYCLRQRNIITPSDGWVDLEDVVLTPFYVEALLRKECFGGKNEGTKERAKAERDIVQKHKGKLVTDLGLALTRHRANLRKIGSGDAIKSGNLSGRVMRELRLQSQGLLLLYPLDPQGKSGIENIDSSVKAIVGFAISFPVAESAIPIEYQVNEVFRANENDSLWSEADNEEDWSEGLEWIL